jgi:hypothetical protein
MARWVELGFPVSALSPAERARAGIPVGEPATHVSS